MTEYKCPECGYATMYPACPSHGSLLNLKGE